MKPIQKLKKSDGSTLHFETFRIVFLNDGHLRLLVTDITYLAIRDHIAATDRVDFYAREGWRRCTVKLIELRDGLYGVVDIRFTASSLVDTIAKKLQTRGPDEPYLLPWMLRISFSALSDYATAIGKTEDAEHFAEYANAWDKTK